MTLKLTFCFDSGAKLQQNVNKTIIKVALWHIKNATCYKLQLLTVV